ALVRCRTGDAGADAGGASDDQDDLVGEELIHGGPIWWGTKGVGSAGAAGCGVPGKALGEVLRWGLLGQSLPHDVGLGGRGHAVDRLVEVEVGREGVALRARGDRMLDIDPGG